MPTMRAAVMVENGRIELMDREIPQPGPGEALVKLEYIGVCGSDMHLFEQEWGKRITKPHILGHECAGSVVALGEGVQRLKAGDRVALEPGKACGSCRYCREGNYNLCPTVTFLGAPKTATVDQVDGAFVEYVVHPAELCFVLPENVSTLEGCLIEPLAVGIHAARQGKAGPGQNAAVIGTGCIGLVSIIALKLFGVSRIFALDVMQNRLDMAKSMGADETLLSTDPDVAERIRAATDGRGCDLVVDTSGSGAAVAQAIDYMKKGGNLVLVGYSRDGSLTIPLRNAINNEIQFQTVFRYRNIYDMAVDSLAAGLADVKQIVTDVFPLERIQEAMEKSIRDKASSIKTVIQIV